MTPPTLETGLNTWLTQLIGLIGLTQLTAYWLRRPDNAENAVVYQCISYGTVSGNLRKTGILRDVYSISVYHNSMDDGKQLADRISKELTDFTGSLGGRAVQLATLNGGRDIPLTSESGQQQYQFVRDFIIHH